MIVVNCMIYGKETLSALAEAAKYCEGTVTVTHQGITIVFNPEKKRPDEMFISVRSLPDTLLLQDLYVAHRIREFVKRLNERKG